MQRDVEVVVETMDRGGTFLGTVVLVPQQQASSGAAAAAAKPFNLALALLSKGAWDWGPNIKPTWFGGRAGRWRGGAGRDWKRTDCGKTVVGT